MSDNNGSLLKISQWHHLSSIMAGEENENEMKMTQ